MRIMTETAERMAAEAIAIQFASGSDASKANSAVLTPYLTRKKESPSPFKQHRM